MTARELEIICSLISADYLVSMSVTGSFASTGMIKNELSMQILKWTVKSSNKGKMNTVNQPSVKGFQAFSFIKDAEFHKDVWVRVGRGVYNKPTVEDWALARDLGGAENAVLEETNMFQDREAEEQASLRFPQRTYCSRKMRSWRSAEPEWPLMIIVPGVMHPSAIRIPLNRVDVAPGTQTQSYDQNTLLSIGIPITSEMAFLTMFSEWLAGESCATPSS